MNPLVRLSMVALLALACLGLTACTFPPRIYRMDVRQGNYICPDMARQLKPGMSKETVQAIMGPPMLSHFFEKNQWDYYHYFKPGNGDPIQERRITVYFKGDQIDRLEEADL